MTSHFPARHHFCLNYRKETSQFDLQQMHLAGKISVRLPWEPTAQCVSFLPSRSCDVMKNLNVARPSRGVSSRLKIRLVRDDYSP